ncbi:hypothetical protein ACIGEZ_19615 [Streptomyces sp. NPDC085481]|uniref:hypothetical protein n=1 Tax=Streptomyces sp. NPDC085481 TaxID=3365727 RepID=UPI0037D20FD8
MDPELAALASSAATALVAAWTTDAWAGVRQRVIRLLGRGDDARAAAAAAELDAGHADVVAAGAAGDVARRAEVERVWSDRLGRLVVEESAAVDELRVVLGVLRQAVVASGSSAGDHVEVHGNTFHGPVQMKGVQHNHG